MVPLTVNIESQMAAAIKAAISVFDLPKLRSQPTYIELLQALESLEIRPTMWDQATAVQQTAAQEAAISRYLMSIISSIFEWFEDSVDTEGQSILAMEQREKLWDLASKRVAERCGRSAMPEMTRTWVIPASASIPELKFEIREPPLTGDNLGLKTWGTAYAIAKKLEDFGQTYFSDLINGEGDSSSDSSSGTYDTSPTRVLELGAGTGLVGIAAGAIWSTNVVLTDLNEIQDNLLHNIRKNSSLVDYRGGNISGEVLDWKNSDVALTGYESKEFEIVIAADSLYDDEHPSLVANMIKKYVKADRNSRALVAVPMRDKKTKGMRARLEEYLAENNFRLISEGSEVCRDDWEGANHDEEVRCWWGIFGLAFPGAEQD